MNKLYMLFPEGKWKAALSNVLLSDNVSNLDWLLEQNNVFPIPADLFNAFKLCPLDSTKVVIIGQDPYHTRGMAHGLAFSVKKGSKIPPTLKNIAKEYSDDLGKTLPYDFSDIAIRGVLFLNTILTVEEGNALSHEGKGWETLTEEAVRVLAREDRKIVFILWGSKAQTFERLIDNDKHLIIKSAHPSPLAAYRGFFGSKPFSRANDFLNEQIF